LAPSSDDPVRAHNRPYLFISLPLIHSSGSGPGLSLVAAIIVS